MSVVVSQHYEGEGSTDLCATRPVPCERLGLHGLARLGYWRSLNSRMVPGCGMSSPAGPM